jgi:hypothetical protein
MARDLRILIVSVAVLTIAAVSLADAQPLVCRPHHPAVARGGDIVVRTPRSYLDPGTSAAVGTENHYFSDSVTYGQTGPSFTSSTAGQELLPTRFNPPGQTEPLFRF